MKNKIYTAPPNTGVAVLGKTLPGLLWEAAETHDNKDYLNDRRDGAWRTLSITEFKTQSTYIAAGLKSLGLERGDRVALFMESDVDFCLADMGCLIAGIVDVPVYLTHSPESIAYVLDHADVKAIFVSDSEKLQAISTALGSLKGLTDVVVFDTEYDSVEGLQSVRVHSAASVMTAGKTVVDGQPDYGDEAVAAIDPHDTATIIYTSGTTGNPKGVVLSHENISFDGLTSFSGLPTYESGGKREVAISFLPMTHVFARSLHYGFLHSGSSTFFVSTDHISEGLKRVKPTVFATVPRVLEKVYAKILQAGVELTGLKKRIFTTALNAAREYEMGVEPSRELQIKLAIADKLVFSKWREAVGGRVEWIICGGASLNAEIANVFAAAGIEILQGYGLTETSPVIAFNRPNRNRAGTVGEPIPGVEVMIAEDGEILTRGPHIMQGYYKNDAKTREVVNDEGWFHTGDIGEFTDEGFLKITDRKKDLFKLSTGKYVMPQPLENRLSSHPMIEQAVVFGPTYKYCTVILFPDLGIVRSFAVSEGVSSDLADADLLTNSVVLNKYQELIDIANDGMDHWSTIKKFKLVNDTLTPESGLLTPSLKVKRSKIFKKYKSVVDSMYDDDDAGHED